MKGSAVRFPDMNPLRKREATLQGQFARNVKFVFLRGWIINLLTASKINTFHYKNIKYEIEKNHIWKRFDCKGNETLFLRLIIDYILGLKNGRD